VGEMAIVLGFGAVEERTRNEIKKLLIDKATTMHEAYLISKEWNENNKKFDVMKREDAPERYTNFYVYDGKIKYNHINRRHPFSPDGWALMEYEEPFLILKE
jgi:hypothetical protein